MIRPLVEMRVRLSPGCRIRTEDEEILIETRDAEWRIRAPHVDTVAMALNRLFRSGVPRKLAADVRLSDNILEPVLQALAQDDLLMVECAADAAADPAEAASALLAEARFHARSIFEQSFWSDLLAGDFSPAQVFGWGVEFYHFVDAANTYMPLGVAHVRRHGPTRALMAQHYIEEMGHGQIFLDGLARCGLDGASIGAAPPLPHTSALINLLTELAIEGEVTYAASFAVMQPGLAPASRTAIDEFYAELSRLYSYARPMFDSFRQHALIDVDMGHEENVFARLCREPGGLTGIERARASWAMSAIAEAFILFFEGIRDSYPDKARFAPRRSLLVSGL